MTAVWILALFGAIHIGFDLALILSFYLNYKDEKQAKATEEDVKFFQDARNVNFAK